MADDQTVPEKEIKNMALGIAFYSGISVLGPLIFFGVTGYFLDKALHGNNMILLASVIFAFFVTNFLIIRKTMTIMAELKKIKSEGKAGIIDDYDDDEDEEEL